jgi:mannose-1-phosphate guanylyltransferase
MMAASRAFEHSYAIILAGGSGTRFWPLSRRRRPKQLVRLFGRKTLLEQTLERISPIIPPSRTYVFTSAEIASEVRRALPRVPRSQIIAEPAARNTAPTLGVAAHEILARDSEAVMVVLPSDHVITRTGEFHRTLEAACRWASVEGRSVAIGIKPTRPDTGYGYVRKGELAGRVRGRAIYKVEKFTEKPNHRLARRYLVSRRYLWNGGMFVWRAATLLANLERFEPRMAAGLASIARAGGARAHQPFRRLYPRLKKISIDFAVMEKISDVYVVPSELGWSDVGSWRVLYELRKKDREGNVRPSASLVFDARGNLIFSPRKFVMAIGIEGLAVIETEDALLVCSLERAQSVGRTVEELARRRFKHLL